MERTTEISALESIYEGTQITMQGSVQILRIPLPVADMQLCVCFGKDESYPRGHTLPPMYLRSQQVPAFHRLHLLQYILRQLHGTRLPDEPVLLDAIHHLENEWVDTQNTPPDLTTVMAQFKIEQTVAATEEIDDLEDKAPELPQRKRVNKRRRARDDRSDAQIFGEFKQMISSPEYQKLLSKRSTLPAANSREELLTVLNKSQVAIIVGDTGTVHKHHYG
jgi:hypothetical protein